MIIIGYGIFIMKRSFRNNVIQQQLNPPEQPIYKKQPTTTLFDLPGYCFTQLPASFINSAIQQIPQPNELSKQNNTKKFRKLQSKEQNSSVFVTQQLDSPEYVINKFFSSPSKKFSKNTFVSLLQDFPSETSAKQEFFDQQCLYQFSIFKQSETPKIFRHTIVEQFHRLKCQIKIQLTDDEFKYINSFTINNQQNQSIFREKNDIYQKEIQRIINLKIRLQKNKINYQFYNKRLK